MAEKITDNEEIIKDTLETFEHSVLEMQDHFTNKKIELSKEIIGDAEKLSSENIDFQSNLIAQNSYKLDYYEDLISTYYETSIITLYSLYEKLFTMLMIENNILKQKKRGSLVNTYVISIKKQYKDLKIDKSTNRSIVGIEKQFRKLRNYFARESHSSNRIPLKLNYFEETEGIVYTKTSILFKNGKYIIQTLNEMKTILLEVNKKIEEQKTKKSTGNN